MNMKHFAVFALFLLFLPFVRAQKPEHLVPVTISEITPVVIDIEQEREINHCFHSDTSLRFFACRNTEKVVGYLIEAEECGNLKALWALGKDEECCRVGLREVQKAEALFAKTLDLRCDSAQQIHRAFTAPRFYEYIRQYVFYTTTDGDTCVHINCVMPDDESLCPTRPSYNYVIVFDGDDYYWTADLNLSKERLISYDVNGPTLYFVEGRNKEPQGLYSERIFDRAWHPAEHKYRFDQLPTAVQKTLLSRMDTARITYCEHFSPKYVWKIHKKKNGEEVVTRKHYKSGNYYRIYSDSLCCGYDAKGRMLYIAPEKQNGRLGRENLSHIEQIDTMIATIARDLSARGRDYAKYGSIRWAEQVSDHYVLAVMYNAPIYADFLHAYYTFDRNGRLEGVALRQP